MIKNQKTVWYYSQWDWQILIYYWYYDLTKYLFSLYSMILMSL